MPPLEALAPVESCTSPALPPNAAPLPRVTPPELDSSETEDCTTMSPLLPASLEPLDNTTEPPVDTALLPADAMISAPWPDSD